MRCRKALQSKGQMQKGEPKPNIVFVWVEILKIIEFLT